MKTTHFFHTLIAVSAILIADSLVAAPLDADVQKKVDAMVGTIKQWAADPVIVNAVKDQNANPGAEIKSMTQDKWKAASVLDPTIRGFTKNAVGTFLKSKKTAVVSEAFVSDASGCKVGFLGKTSGWCHKGKAKHDKPMAGETWQGDVEVDDSTGLQQVQISVPVLDGDKPIGSLVVGLALSKLGK